MVTQFILTEWHSDPRSNQGQDKYFTYKAEKLELREHLQGLLRLIRSCVLLPRELHVDRTDARGWANSIFSGGRNRAHDSGAQPPSSTVRRRPLHLGHRTVVKTGPPDPSLGHTGPPFPQASAGSRPQHHLR